ncbi:MAG: hypothetical protein KDG51_15390, partial [Calditrichaeota bacterium]|nr:hypothetical protein [Calditrichota bacterium]
RSCSRATAGPSLFSREIIGRLCSDKADSCESIVALKGDVGLSNFDTGYWMLDKNNLQSKIWHLFPAFPRRGQI